MHHGSNTGMGRHCTPLQEMETVVLEMTVDGNNTSGEKNVSVRK